MATPEPTPRYGSVEGVRDLLSRDWDTDDHGEVSPPDDTAAGLSVASLGRRLESAANQVDTALAPYYPTPFTDTVPGIVNDLTEAIAAYLAELTMRQSEDMPADDPVRLRYQWALVQLERIGAGEIELPGVPRKPNPVTGHGAIAGAPVNPVGARMFGGAEFGLVADRGRVTVDWGPESYGRRRR